MKYPERARSLKFSIPRSKCVSHPLNHSIVRHQIRRRFDRFPFEFLVAKAHLATILKVFELFVSTLCTRILCQHFSTVDSRTEQLTHPEQKPVNH